MKIELDRLNDAFHMEAKNDLGNTVQIDGSPDHGLEISVYILDSTLVR